MIKGRMRIEMGTAFADGLFAMAVEPEVDFDKRQSGANDTQKRDKDTGERMWVVRCVDGDEDAQKRGQAELKVTIVAPVQPVLPDALPGTPFRPVEFENLTVFPYVDGARCKGSGHPQCRGRVAYSFRATGMRSPARGAHSATTKAA
ncbi:plasmid replication, integration and excision activator [Cryptosporangium japonicum]|uniref:Plasmid replication, integration and excision activator n=1 Tax=Cryptosporangium japonicum TaxID=80872 RepID=A0ABP3E063_9ACTN